MGGEKKKPGGQSRWFPQRGITAKKGHQGITFLGPENQGGRGSETRGGFELHITAR